MLTVAGAPTSRTVRAAHPRDLAVWSLSFLAAVSMFDLGLPDARPSRPAGLLVAGICFVVLGIDGRRSRLGFPHLLAAIVVGFFVASTTWSPSDESTIVAFTMLQLLALFVLVYEFASSPTAWRRILLGLGAGGTILSVLVLRQFLSSEIVDGGRYTGFSEGDPNDVAWGIAIGSTVLAHAAFDVRNRYVRLACVLAAGLGIPATMLTGSRSGVVVFAVGMLSVACRLPELRPVSRAKVIVGALAGAIALSFVVPVDADLRAVERITANTGEGSGTAKERDILLDEGFSITADHPVIGIGGGAVEDEMWERRGIRLGVHNSFVSVAAQVGLFAGAAWLLLWFASAVNAIRSATDVRWVATGIVLLTVVELMFRHAETQKLTWLVAALALAVPVAARRVEIRAT